MSRRTALLSLTLLAVLAFGISLPNPLIFDDTSFIAGNRWLRWDFIPNFFRSAIPTSNLSFFGYRPLLMTTFTIERELFRAFPWVLRLTNLLLHTGVAFLVFENARKILNSDRLALLAASFFLLHPVQTNVIGLIWKRSDLLLAAGVLVSLLFARKWSEASEGKTWNLAMVFAGALVALLSKESALVLPVAIFLGDRLLWKVERSWRSTLFFLYLPLLVVSGIHAWILFVKVPQALAAAQIRGVSYMPPSMLFDRWHYVLAQGPAFLEYLSLTFWPVKLRVFHALPAVQSFLDVRFLTALFVVACLVGGAIYLRRRAPVVSFGILFFLLLLLPSSSVVPLNLPFDEDRLYVSLFGFSLIVVSAGGIVFERLKARGLKLALVSLRILPVLLCALFVLQDGLRLRTWRDPVHLWSENVRDDPGDPRAWVNLGEALADHQSPLAVKAYEKAAELDRSYGLPHLYLGFHYVETNQPEKGEAALWKAFELDAFPADVFCQLGVLEARKKEPGKAARYFSLSLAADPGKTVTLRNYSTLLARAGEFEASFRALRAALLVNPEDPQTQLQLAYFLQDHRHDREGAAVFVKRVLEAEPENPMALDLAKKLGLR